MAHSALRIFSMGKFVPWDPTMGSTAPPTPQSASTSNVQNQVLGDQYVYGDQNFNVRSEDAQSLVQDCLRSLAYPEMNDRSNAIGLSTGGTCEWLLRHKIWKKWKSSQRGLLWIKGKPGSGKSTLLRYALHELRSTKMTKKALVLSFFFHGRGTELQKNQLGLFRSLLHQVLSNMPEELAEVVTTFQQRRDGTGTPGADWTWELDELRELFKWSILNVLKNRQVWIFVDALDESGAENARAVIRHFNDLIQAPSTRLKLRICFACRHYPIQNWDDGFEICTEHENRQDILTYVRAQLSGFKNPTAIALPDLIAERSNGLFIWARLVVDRVLDLELAEGPMSHEQQINDIIDTLPRDLNTLYAGIVRDMEKTPASLKMMQWISCARRPLSLDELRWAMVVDPDSQHTSLRDYKNTPDYTESNDVMERKVKTLTHGLAEIIRSSETRVVQFIHQSIKDFFDKRAQESLEEPPSDTSLSIIEVANYKLYRTCIHYLGMEEIAQLPERENMSAEQLHHMDQAALSDYPLLSYATTSWIAHLKGSQESHQEGSQPFSWPPEATLKRWINTPSFAKEGRDSPLPGVTLVHVLARYGMVVALQKLLSEKHVDINARDSLYRRPLHYAADGGHTATVQLLLEARAIVNYQDFDNAAPLHLAAFRGHVSIMRLLLARGADVDMKARNGCTPLVWAIEGKREAAINMILDEGVDVNCEYVCPGFSRVDKKVQPFRFDSPSKTVYPPWVLPRQLYLVSDLRNYVPFRHVLAESLGFGHSYSQIGPWTTRARPEDRTPLLRAVELGSRSIVVMLLAKGANPRLECRTGWSALSLARFRGFPSDRAVVGLLKANIMGIS